MSAKLHPSYLFFLVYMTQSGIIIFSLPRITAETFGTNGWLAIPIVSLGVVFLISLYGCVYRWSNDKSLYSIIEEMLPKYSYKILYIFFSLFWTILAFTLTKNYVFLVKSLYYPLTNIHWLMLIMTMLIYFFVTSQISSIFKATVILFFLTAWMVLLPLGLLPDFELVRLTSFIFAFRSNLLEGSIQVYSAFLGFEIIFFFLHYVQRSAKTMKYIYLGHLYTTLVYLIVTFISYGFTSFEHLITQSYPLIDLFRYIELPFIERLDGLYFMFFLMKIIVTATLYLFVSIEMFQRSIQSIKASYIPVLLCVIGFIGTYPLFTKYDIDFWLSNIVYVQTVISIILPVILILYLHVKRRKDDV